MSSAPSGRGSRKSGTRRQLLDAAAQVVAEKGFAGASLMEIAERAQLTTGAVYSNFRSKEALLLALITDQLDRAGDNPPRTPRELLDVARQAAVMPAGSDIQEVLRSQVEIFLLGLRDATVRHELQRREAALVDDLAGVLAAVDSEPQDLPPPTLTQLAEVFFATMQGLQQHRMMFAEALPPAVFEWWATTILRAALDVNREAAGRRRRPAVSGRGKRTRRPA
ncbi:MAG: TetR/AcrR family transcriptional regulator [Candidatus Dormibacteria bacterium]